SLYAGTVILTKLTKNTPPALIVMIQTFVGIFVLLPFADFSALPETSSQWGYIITLGVIHTFLLYCLIFSAYQKLNVSVIAILSFV
ncbi:EamA family transporter, partial [Pseudomonas sp. SIMBA_044]|uniref:EamA family transporter n=1 Tax=Pseudomonas sp. SIMBA_044 TaxID=3085785 RepID=UPI00397C5F0E